MILCFCESNSENNGVTFLAYSAFHSACDVSGGSLSLTSQACVVVLFATCFWLSSFFQCVGEKQIYIFPEFQRKDIRLSRGSIFTALLGALVHTQVKVSLSI